MIERFYVQNFRCLQGVTLDLAGRPSALLIGKNGAGKSTIRKALAILQSICRGPSRVGSLISQADFTFHRITEPMRFEIDVTLSARRFKYAVAFDWPATFREARVLDESLQVDGQTIFNRQLAQIHLAGGTNFGLDWHVFALPVINERPGERALQDLKEFLASMILIAPLPTLMDGFSEEPSTELEEEAGNYASCLRALLENKPRAYSAFDSYVRSVIPDFSSIENVDRGPNGKQLVVEFKPHDATDSFKVEFKSLSDGEKCFFLSAYIIASNAVGSRAVCLWDEPDNHLSLSEVGQFITSLRKMTHSGGQFIATTHHSGTIRSFSDDTTLVLTRKSHLDPTRARPLTEFSYTGDLVHALVRDEIVD